MTSFGIINVHEHVESMHYVPKLLEAMRRNHVVKTVIVGTSGATIPEMSARSRREDTRSVEILRIANTYPEYFIPFLAVNRPGAQNLGIVKRHLELGVKGLEICSGDSNSKSHDFSLDDQTLTPMYEFCERRKVPIIFHINLDHYQDDFERILTRFPNLKAMCPLLDGSVSTCERAEHLMRSYPNLYTDTSMRYRDLFNQTIRGYSRDSERLRALVVTYQDRILFGTNNVISIASHKTTEWMATRIRIYRDLLEKNVRNFSDIEESALMGLHLDVRVLLKVYRSNAESFLEMSGPKGKTSVLSGRPGGQRRRDVRERVNWSRVRDLMTESVASPRPVDETFLFALNRLVLESFPEQGGTRGRYRNKSVVIRRMGNVMYIPPRAANIPSLMKQLLESINNPYDCSDIEHVARLFLRLQEIHPFNEGNGRTGRALATLLLRKKGFREKKSQSLEMYFDSNTEDYYDILYQNRNGDPLPWLLFFTDAVESVMSDRPSKKGLYSSIAARLSEDWRRLARL